MMEPPFEKLLGRLLADEVGFIVVGGLAVTLNGYVRLTEDVDLLVDPSPENVARVIRSLSGFGEGFGGELSPADFGPEPGAIRIVEESENCQMDLFTILSGLTYDDLIKDASVGELGGCRFHFASKTQLIRIKSGSVREKDRLDANAMRQLLDDPRAFD